MADSLITIYGGKYRIARYIMRKLPFPLHTVYAEPFAGGASPLFVKGLPKPANMHNYREAINDINGLLISLYRVAKERPDALSDKLSATAYSKLEYDRAVAIYRAPEQADELDQAWAAYVCSFMGFSGIWGAGWRRAVKGRNPANTWNNKLKTLRRRMDRLKEVHIDNVDAIDFIRYWDSPQTVFYCDPPYPGADQGHYGGYTVDDFAALVETLSKCRASFVLSNYDQPLVSVPLDWNRYEIQTTMSAANSKRTSNGQSSRRVEVVWIKDRSAGVELALRQHLWSPAPSEMIAEKPSQTSIFDLLK